MATETRIKELMAGALPWDGSWDDVTNETSLLSTNIIDSLGMLKLISVIEEDFAIEIDDEDVVPEHWDTISAIASFVESKRG